MQDIAASRPDAERITLVTDNLNTHTPSSPYEAFPTEEAKALWDRFEFVYMELPRFDGHLIVKSRRS